MCLCMCVRCGTTGPGNNKLLRLHGGAVRVAVMWRAFSIPGGQCHVNADSVQPSSRHLVLLHARGAATHHVANSEGARAGLWILYNMG